MFPNKLSLSFILNEKNDSYLNELKSESNSFYKSLKSIEGLNVLQPQSGPYILAKLNLPEKVSDAAKVIN